MGVVIFEKFEEMRLDHGGLSDENRRRAAARSLGPGKMEPMLVYSLILSQGIGIVPVRWLLAGSNMLASAKQKKLTEYVPAI